MRSETVILPAFLASALINGDTSGLEEADLQWLEAAVAYCAPGHIVSCEGEAFFTWGGTDLPGFTLGCEALEYVVLYSDREGT